MNARYVDGDLIFECYTLDRACYNFYQYSKG